MDDLISRQALLRDIEKYHLSDGMFQHWVEVQPSIDAVEVVRCKDCKYQDKGENESESWNVCNYRPWLYFSIDDDDYCSNGERKGGLTDDHNTGKI